MEEADTAMNEDTVGEVVHKADQSACLDHSSNADSACVSDVPENNKLGQESADFKFAGEVEEEVAVEERDALDEDGENGSELNDGPEEMAADKGCEDRREDGGGMQTEKDSGRGSEGKEDNQGGLKAEEEREEETAKKERSARDGEFTSEIFKIHLGNLPTRFGFKQLRNMLEGLKLKPKKIKAMHNKDYAFITFPCEADRQTALEILNKHTWKGWRLSAKVAAAREDPIMALKRREEHGGGDQKRARGPANPEDEHLPVEDRLNNVVTPLWKQDYQQQLTEKQKNKEGFLRKLANMVFKEIPDLQGYIKSQRKQFNGMCCPLEEIKPSPLTAGYRNKCEFSIGTSPDGEEKTVGFRLGLYKGGLISVVNPASCLNVPDQSKAVVQAFQTYIRQSCRRAYDPMTHEGNWRMLTVRTTQGSGVMAMVTFHRQSLSDEEVAEEKKLLGEYFGSGEGGSCSMSSLYIHVQRQGDKNVVDFEHLSGDRHITEDLLQLKFRISPQAFFQVNTLAAEVLYQTIGDWAEVNKTTTLLDICCGTGTIGISLAKRVERVIGVELTPQAVEDAKENAAINGVANVTFHCGKAEELLPDITNKLHHCLDVVGIVDPPRAGLHPRVVQAVRRCPRLNRFVYVSCDAQQASKNFVNFLRPMSKKQKGVPFTLVKAIPVDLFPHTPHCELVLLFERNLQKPETQAGSKEGEQSTA